MRNWMICGLAAALAAPAAASGGWQFNMVPYVWAAGMDGRLSHAGLPRNVAVNTSFGDTLENLDIGGMLAVEGRKGRVGFVLDGLYAKVSKEARIPLVGLPAEAGARMFTGMAAGQYRVVDDAAGSLDLVAGIRYWNVKTSFAYAAPAGAPLPPGMPGAYALSEQVDWVDGMAGAKAVVRLSPAFSLNAHGMLGAGGSRFAADALVALGIRLGGSTSQLMGYRHINADYHNGGFAFDASMHGPIAGLGIRF